MSKKTCDVVESTRSDICIHNIFDLINLCIDTYTQGIGEGGGEAIILKINLQLLLPSKFISQQRQDINKN